MSTWTEETTARERVQQVAETLSEPASVAHIGKQANVAWDTASDELTRLEKEGKVDTVQREGRTLYRLNPVNLLFDEIKVLIAEHTREELESQLIDYQSQAETLSEEYEAGSVEELRMRLSDDSLRAGDMRELRNVASTWTALETECRLLRHAIQLYEDVTSLSLEHGSEMPALS